MRTKTLLSVAILLVCGSPAVGAEEIAGLPLHTEELGPGAIRVWLGDHVSTTNVVAFATEEGIVVVDTFGVPDVDAELRTVIARELGRSDFRYLINTHEHGDHTGGNTAYDDCTIVGHELVPKAMAAAAQRSERILDWYSDRFSEMENELASLEAGSPEAAALGEELIYKRLFFDKIEAGVEAVPPNLMFRDRMTLDLGDTTFELAYSGGMHSQGDITVFVPERGLLLTGDLMADAWLIDTPGCLSFFAVRDGIPHDFPRFLTNWDRLLADQEHIERLLPGHWNGELSTAGANARIEYVRALWDGVRDAAAAGSTLPDVQADYRLDSRFPELVGSPGFSPQINYASITELWREVTDQESAARTLFTLLSDGADEAAIRQVVEARDDESTDYFFSETELNAYGYAFVQRGDFDNAVRIFEINVELFPESWNVYDSLGEALAARGDADRAMASYLRSLELNPESETGRAYVQSPTASETQG